MAVYEFKQGDTAPLEATLSDRDGPVRLDAPGTLVTFAMGKADDNLVITGPCVIVDDGSTEMRGKVVYEWGDGDTSDPGVYRAELTYTSPSGIVKTFPNDGWEDVIIRARV